VPVLGDAGSGVKSLSESEFGADFHAATNSIQNITGASSDHQQLNGHPACRDYTGETPFASARSYWRLTSSTGEADL
jgi:hypothetical protein